MAQRRAELLSQIRGQQRWISRCGGDLAGYMQHYGSLDDPKHFGSGGEAIYQADTEFLAKLVHQLGDSKLLVWLDEVLEGRGTP